MPSALKRLIGLGVAVLTALPIGAAPAAAYGPSNDSFAYAATLSGMNGSVREATADATREGGEPAHLGYASGRSVWYSWTPSSTGTAVFSTAGSTFDTVVAVYTGRRVDRLTFVAAADGGTGSEIGTSLLSFSATAGVTYMIAVDGAAGASGRVELAWNRPPPPNDSLASAQPIGGASGSVDGSLVWATGESGELGFEYSLTWSSVWYRWTAPATGPVGWQQSGSGGFDVFTGTSLQDLAWLSVSYSGETWFWAQASETYLIRVRIERDPGPFTLTWRAITPPANDNFGAAQPVQGLSGVTTGSLLGAGREPGEPAHQRGAGSPTVWYRWTAPVNGSSGVTVRSTSGGDISMAIYTGSSVSGLTRVAEGFNYPGAGSSSASFTAVAGTTYSIAVAAYQTSAPRSFEVQWQRHPPDNDSYHYAPFISGHSNSVSGDNYNATKESPEANHAGNPGGRSVWYRFYSSLPGVYRFDTSGSSFDTLLAVYRNPWDATSIASNDNIGTSATSQLTFTVEESATYYIAVDGRGGAMGTIRLNWVLLADPPPNDNFAAAIAISGETGSVRGSNYRATAEAGEPSHARTAARESIWYSWTAPRDGRATFQTESRLAIYTGSSLTALTPVASDGPAQTHQGIERAYVSFIARHGVTYRIALDSAFGSGRTLLSWHEWPMPPPNDNFAAAQPIQGVSGSVRGSNVGATLEADEPRHSSGIGGASVWYRWTAPESGTFAFDTFGSDVDTHLAVYRGPDLANLSGMAFDDNARGRDDLTSRVQFGARAGVTYYIAIEGPGATYGWSYLQLNWRRGTAPTNDNFAAATVLQGESGTVTGDSSQATIESGEPRFGNQTMWYRWTATRSGRVSMHTVGSDYSTRLGVYEGNVIDALAIVAQNTQAPGAAPQSRVDFDAVAGRVYSISVGAYGAGGRFQLSWNTPTPPPANDDVNSAQLISGVSGSVTGSTYWATRKADEPSYSTYNSSFAPTIWYRWVAPQDGLVTFDTVGSSIFGMELDAYRGHSRETLQYITSMYWSEFVHVTPAPAERRTFPVVAGESILIQVFAWYGYSGPVKLNWSIAPPANDAFASAAPLAGFSGEWHGTNHRASHEPGEPLHNGREGVGSLWWAWTPTRSGTATVEIWDNVVADVVVYTGDTLSGLRQVAVMPQFEISMEFPVTAGTTYRIVHNDVHSYSFGDVELSWSLQYDFVRPTGTVTINGGEELTTSTQVTLSVPARDDDSGVALLRVSNSPPNFEGMLSAARTTEYSASTTWSLTSAVYGGKADDGAKTVFVQWRDANGNWSAVASDTITLDASGPMISAPTHGPASDWALGTDTVPMRVGWSASDAGSGIARFELQMRTDTGPYTAIALPTATTTGIVRHLAHGSAHQFRVRAQDHAGNWSAWVYGASFRLSAMAETSSSIGYSGSWTRSASSSAHGGYTKWAQAAGASAKFTFTGRQVAWVAPRGTRSGQARIYVDGVYATTVDLYRSTSEPRRIVFSRAWTTSGTHTLEVRVVGTSGHPVVTIDSFVVTS